MLLGKCGALVVMLVGIASTSLYPMALSPILGSSYTPSSHIINTTTRQPQPQHLHNNNRNHNLVVGHIPAGLPAIFRIPPMPEPLPFTPYIVLSVIQIALVGFTEAYTIARVNAEKYPRPPPPVLDQDKEMLALAACNAWTGLVVGGYCVTGSFSRTAVNAEGGAVTTWASAVAAVTVACVLMFFTEQLSLLPKPCVSVIVVSAVLGLVDLGEPRRLWGKHREMVVYCVVLCTSLGVGVEVGLLVGVVVDVVWGWIPALLIRVRNPSGPEVELEMGE